MRAKAAVIAYILHIGWVCEATLLRCNAKLEEMFSLQKKKDLKELLILYFYYLSLQT